MADKAVWTGIDQGKNQCFSGRIVFDKTIILLRLAGFKMIITNSVCYLLLHI